ncbi:MAG: RNA methyltransferase [Lachnospiraceae bacterium]|nr:RNA methyltransferase [Lachnospiraceae bacterium]
MLIEVRDLAMEELQVFVELNEVQLARFYEPKTGLFIAESDKVAKRALEAGFRPHSYLIEDKKLERARPLFEDYPDVPVYVAKHDDITTITGYNLTGGILVAMYRQEKPTVSGLLDTVTDRKRNGSGRLRIAVMEGIVNPANVGAIIRSAAALNADAVLVTKDCADPLYRRAIRVGMGCVFQIPWTYIPPLADGGIPLLKDLGFTVAAMALLDDTLPIDAPVLKQCDKLALVFGAEGEGLLPATIASCDHTVKIPMSHGVDSLNVAASSAVAFWEVRDRK